MKFCWGVVCLFISSGLVPAATPSGFLAFSTYLGGDSIDVVQAMATDAQGNIYLTGGTYSANFPVTANAFQPQHGGTPGTMSGFIAFPADASDAFVVKLSPAGKILYSTYLGGSSNDLGRGIAVDGVGSAYVVGSTSSPNFPTTKGALQPTLAGGVDLFVAKLDPTGSALVYSTYLGGRASETASAALAIDSAGNAYVGGSTGSADFPAVAGAYRRDPAGGAFVVKLNVSGSALAYSNIFGGGSGAITSGLAVDTSGNLYAAGSAPPDTFPTTTGAIHNTVAAGLSGVFVVKLNASGSNVLYSAFLGGNNDSFASGIAIDAQGDAYVAGSTNASDFPVTPGAYQTRNAGKGDVFVAKLDPSASKLLYSTLWGGSDTDRPAGIAVDSSGNAFIAGATFSTDLPNSADALSKRFTGGICLSTGGTPFGNPPIPVACGDAFAAKFDATGSVLLYSTYLSGSDRETASAVALDASGNFFVTGSTRSNDFPMLAAPISDQRFQSQCAIVNSPSSREVFNCEDAFVAKFSFGDLPLAPALRVLNFGSLIEQPVARAEIVTIFGQNLGPTTVSLLQVDAAGHIATTLAGTRVLFNGVPGPLVRTDSTQITAIVPNGVVGPLRVEVEQGGAIGASTTIAVAPIAPAVLTLTPTGSGQAAALNLDGTVNSRANPAEHASIVSLFVIGMGMTAEEDGAIATAARFITAPVVVIGGYLAEVLYAGPSPESTAALTQLNVRLPDVSGEALPVFLVKSGFGSQPGVTLAVK